MFLQAPTKIWHPARLHTEYEPSKMNGINQQIGLNHILFSNIFFASE